MSQKTDEELIEGFQNGDVSAFNELVRRYQERVYWIARRLVGTHPDADDVAQEVFIKVHRALREFRSESSFYTWLYRITVNQALNLQRRKRAREFLHYDNVMAQLSSGDSLLDEATYGSAGSRRPDEQLEDEEQRALVEKAISQLPTKQRTVFVLRYYENLPYEDIARIMKRSVGGMKANYFQAVKKIGKFLKSFE